MTRWLSASLIVFLVILGGWPSVAQRATKAILTQMEKALMIKGAVADWHLDPLHQSLVIQRLHLSDTEGGELDIPHMKVRFEGLSERERWRPRYAIEMTNPKLTVNRSTEGVFQFGTLRFPKPHPETNHGILPHEVSVSKGMVEIVSHQGSSTSITQLDDVSTHLLFDSITGRLSLRVSFEDPLHGQYTLNLQNAAAKAPLDITVALKDAHLAVWKNLLPSATAWVPESGVLSGQFSIGVDPQNPKEYRLQGEGLRLDHLQLRHLGEQPTPFNVAHIESSSFLIDAARHHYQVEGLEVMALDSPHLSLERITAPRFDNDTLNRVPIQAPVTLIGLSHDLTRIREMTLIPSNHDDAEHMVRLETMDIREITGPRVVSASVHLKALSFDTQARLLRAEEGVSPELTAPFGTLKDIKAHQMQMTFQDERLTFGRLDFGNSQTKTFQTERGFAKNIIWDRLQHVIKVQHTHLEHPRMQHLKVGTLDAMEATFENSTKRTSVALLKISDARMIENETSPHPDLAIKEVHLHGFQNNPENAHWSAGQVGVSSATMEWIIHPDNQFEIKGLKSGLGKKASANEPNTPTKHWTYDIRSIALTQSDVQLKDLGTTPPTLIHLSDLDLKADDLDTRANDDTDIDAKARIGSHGSLTVSGRLARNPLSAFIRFDLKQFRLAPIAPYWNALSRLTLKRGRMDLSGELRLLPGEERHVEFEGDAHIDDFETLDPTTQRRILCFKALDLDDIAYSSHPKRFYTRIMDWHQAYVHLALKPDHHLNLVDLFRVEKSQPVPSEFKAMTFQASPHHEPPHAAIGLVRFSESQVDYSDLNLKPNLSTSIRDLHGTIKGLSTRRDATADISLMGKINRNSPVRLSGLTEPMDYRDRTDILLDFTGLNLTSFPQYAGRFSGYRIDRGKLNMDLHYKIDRGEINVDNRTMIDRLTLGEKLEDDRHSLVDLALWILMDTRGNLDIDLPIYGDLENPSYELGTLYGQALFQLFSKIFTSPATFVQDLLPTSHLTFSLPFTPGEREVSPTIEASLSNLVNAFRAQEGGIIEITPTASPEADGEALAAEALTEELKTSYIREQRLNGKPIPSREHLHLSDESLKRQLKKYYRARHPEASNDVLSTSEDDPMEPLISGAAWKHALEDWHSGPDVLLDLAEDRAEAIRSRLIHHYGVGDEWIYLRQAEFLSGKNPIPIHVEYFSD